MIKASSASHAAPQAYNLTIIVQENRDVMETSWRRGFSPS